MQVPAPWHHTVASNQRICMTIKIKMARKMEVIIKHDLLRSFLGALRPQSILGYLDCHACRSCLLDKSIILNIGGETGGESKQHTTPNYMF